METKTKLAIGSSVVTTTGVLLLSAYLRSHPSPPPTLATTSATPSPQATTTLGFKRSAAREPLTAVANVSSALVRFEPVPQSSVPRGLGRVSRAGSVLMVQVFGMRPESFQKAENVTEVTAEINGETMAGYVVA